MRTGALVIAGVMLATVFAVAPPGASSGPSAADPLVVVAHIDVGINPYHSDFAWDDPRASQHPCTYIPAYPCSAVALNLHLDEADWDTAHALDAATWFNVTAGTLYYIPGTKIVGAIAFNGDGQTFILDDHGHGTMTASRSAGNSHSLCRECLFVSIEGLGTEGVTWAADQGWIDVQTNSWGYTLPLPLDMNPIAHAAARMPVLFASGNGLFFQGIASEPDYTSTGAPGTIQVGGHDNGHLLSWPGNPPHVIADAYAPWTATRDSLDVVRPDPVACCTSTAAPYAAGGAAAIVLEAKRLLGSLGAGRAADGILAQGPSGLVAQGPLADGDLTLAELRSVLFHTATLRPVAGPDDGLVNWLADPVGNSGAVLANPAPYLQSPGQNPYCPGCVTSPVRFADIPADVPLFDREGFGAVDPTSVALAKAVLQGAQPEPQRPVEDAVYAGDQAVREALLLSMNLLNGRR